MKKQQLLDDATQLPISPDLTHQCTIQTLLPQQRAKSEEHKELQQACILFEEPEEVTELNIGLILNEESTEHQQAFFEELQERLIAFEEPQQLIEQDLILFDEQTYQQQELTPSEEQTYQQQELTPSEEQQQHLPQRTEQFIKPLQQRNSLQHPLIAIVLPLQYQHSQQPQQSQEENQHRLESTAIESEVFTQINNEDLLRRHNIIDCSVIIGTLEQSVEVLSPPVQMRRKRKAERDPTYYPSRRIRRQSVGWAETRELRILPMREVRNLRDDVEILNES